MEYTIHFGEDTLKQLDEIVNGGGESGGGEGGGSSDFSTAEVTITLNKTGTGFALPTMYGAVADDEYNSSIIALTSGINKVILYKGMAAIVIQGGTNVTINSVDTTGDIEWDDGLATVRGNGTITVNYATLSPI